MKLLLDDDQKLLAETARNAVDESRPLARLRSLRDDRDPLGHTPECWKQMAELGWTGIPFAEDVGGLGLGLAEVVLVTEALGRGLAPEPYLSAIGLAAQAIELGGVAAQREEWLPKIIDGTARLAFAYQEAGSRFDPHRVEARAERDGDAFRLSGEKLHVLDAWGADGLVVSARHAGSAGDREGIGLFLLASGDVEVESQWRVDSRSCGIVRFDGAAGTVVGELDRGADLLEDVLDRATVALCGEMLGSLSEALDRTLAYLKERVQFGVPIGSFQGLKHRAARLFMEQELSRSVVMAAARSFDEGKPEAAGLASVAKARLSDAGIQVANEAIQMHGGIGMTDEHDIGFYLKRARVAEMTFGDAAYHRDRYARLSAY